ncbi:MAG: hypothetical protein ABIH23_04985 [bacterium]
MVREMRELTEKDLAMFEADVRKWQTKLGLTNWDVLVRMSKEPTSGATVMMNNEQQSALVKIASKQAKGWSAENMDEFALHEMMHLVLQPLDVAARQCEVLRKDEADKREHEIINRLVNVIKELKPKYQELMLGAGSRATDQQLADWREMHAYRPMVIATASSGKVKLSVEDDLDRTSWRAMSCMQKCKVLLLQLYVELTFRKKERKESHNDD